MNLNSKISYNPQILTSDMGNETVMLNIDNSQYYGAESVAKLIWQLIEKPITIEYLIDQLLEKFVVNREQCIQEVYAYLEDLHEEGLIQVDS